MPRSLLWLAALVACAGGPPAATQANTAPQVVAPDSTARRLLATLDPAIAQEVGYATPRNFTSEPLPVMAPLIVRLTLACTSTVAEPDGRDTGPVQP